MRWNQGRDVIDRMLADSELQRVPASREARAKSLLTRSNARVSRVVISPTAPRPRAVRLRG